MPQPVKIGFLMDPIESIKPYKDSTFAMMLEAQRRGWEVHYFQQSDMFVEDGLVQAEMQTVQLTDDNEHWFEPVKRLKQALGTLDCIVMRKDPPFDMEYIYSTYMLELAERDGCLVINKPGSIRDANEKFFTTHFPQLCPETLISRDMSRISDFHDRLGHIVVKPLDGMGGEMIFQIGPSDKNKNVILETITHKGTVTAMAQRFLPEYRDGDKRILLVNGEPFDYALARIPAAGEARANLAAGATSKGVALTSKEREICATIGPVLKEMGLMFVGLDVIGDYVTEINVTSPTCIRELDALYSANIAGTLMDAVETTLTERKTA